MKYFIMSDWYRELVIDKCSFDYKTSWLIRASGYALINVLDGKRKYSFKTKKDVYEWFFINQDIINCI